MLEYLLLILIAGIFLISSSFKELSKYILGWIYTITIRDIIFFFLSIVVYFLIKQPLNSFIYDFIDSELIAFLIALFLSFIVSKYSRKLLTNFLKKLYYGEHLDLYVIDCIIYIIYLVENNIIFERSILFMYANNYSTMPRFSPRQLNNIQRHRDLLMRQARNLRKKGRAIEIVASAMDNDRSDTRHGSLYDALTTSVVRPIRHEYQDKVTEIHTIFNLCNQGRDIHLYPYYVWNWS